MNVAQARLAGLKAFEAGMGRAPALNKEFTQQAFNQTETKLTELLDGYLNGWDVANLASNAIPGAPSIKAYADIVTNAAAHSKSSSGDDPEEEDHHQSSFRM